MSIENKEDVMMANRNPYWDNAKAILMIAVVLGHFLESYLNNSVAKSVYLAIYLFHMPAFVFISGYFSKMPEHGLKKIFIRLAIPYLIFQAAYSVLLSNSNPITVPVWILWYLFCLFFWRSALYLAARSAWFLPVSISISILAGMVPYVGYYLSLSRMAYFFPFFLLGYYLSGVPYAKVTDMFRFGRRISAFVVIALLAVVIILSGSNASILYGSYSYASLGMGNFVGAAQRFMIYFLSIASIWIFFGLIPSKENILSRVGRKSVYAFLLHGFIILFFNKFLVGHLDLPTIVLMPLFLVLSVGITYLLTTERLTRHLNPLIEPRF